MILSSWRSAKSAPTSLQKRDAAHMRKVRKKLLISIFVLLIVLNAMTVVIYANEEDEVNVHITTTEKEFKRLYEWFLKDRYEISVDGGLAVRAYVKKEIPVNKIEDSRGRYMLPVQNIIDFFTENWPYILGGLGFVFVIIITRVKYRNRWDEYDYFYYEEPPVQYNEWEAPNSQETINLYQRLGRLQTQPQPNMYYYTNYDEPYIIPRRDYSRYNESGQFNLIRQKVMYYK